MSRSGRASWVCGLGIAVALVSGGCRETPKPSAETPTTTPKTEPAARPEVPSPAPETNIPPPASQPAATQAVKPERPKPKYEDVPPYRVVITVGSPDDPQAGWLHIDSQMNDKQEATVYGQFPEANKMDVDTNNVADMTLDLSMLPIRPRQRIILRIDKQGIELSQKHRGKIQLNRGATGKWEVMTPIPR